MKRKKNRILAALLSASMIGMGLGPAVWAEDTVSIDTEITDDQSVEEISENEDDFASDITGENPASTEAEISAPEAEAVFSSENETQEADTVSEERKAEETELSAGEEAEVSSEEAEDAGTSLEELGESSKNIFWKLSSDGVLTISGIGTMPDYGFEFDEEGFGADEDRFPWADQRASVKKVIINVGITSITEGAFWDCENLTTAELPDSLTSIGKYAFYFDEALTSVSFGTGLTTIEESAFDNCSALRQVKLPDGVETIGANAFDTCSALTEATLGKSLKKIGNESFANCSALKKLNIPSTVTEIGESAFDTCEELEEIHFSGDAPSIGENAFADTCCAEGIAEGTALKVYYPSGNTTWDSIVSGTNTYGAEAIKWIPEGLSWEFDSQSGVLKILSWAAETEEFTSAAEVPWYDDGSNIKRVEILEGVKKLGAHALEGCNNLRCVWFEGKKPEINSSAFQNVNTVVYCRADQGWTSDFYGDYGGTLNWVRWKLADSKLTLDGKGKMEDVSNYQEGMEDDAVTAWRSDLPWSDKISDIENVEIGEGIEYIGIDSFTYMLYLENVTIKGDVVSIGSRAFSNCWSLTHVYFSEEHNLTTIGAEAFKGCKSLKRVYILDGVTTIGNKAFADCDALVSAVLHEDITSIGEGAFESNTALFGYDAEEKNAAEKYAEDNGLSYTKLNSVNRDVIGFNAARDGWCLTNDYTVDGQSQYISEDLYFDVYGITTSSLTYNIVNGILNKVRRDLGDGRCVGFSLSAAANFTGQLDLKKYFNRIGDGLNEYGYDSIVRLGEYPQQQFFNIQDNTAVQQLIDRIQVSQYSEELKDAQVLEDDLWLDLDGNKHYYKKLFEYLKKMEFAPLVVTLETLDEWMHAVVLDTNPGSVVQQGNLYKIPVYDPNCPYLTTHLDEPGHKYTNAESGVFTDVKSFLLLDTATREWKLIEDGKVAASESYYFCSLDVVSIKFYDPSKLPDYYFTGKLALWPKDKLTTTLRNNTGISKSTAVLHDFTLKDSAGNSLMIFTNGNVTYLSDEVTVTDVEMSNGAVAASADGEAEAVGATADTDSSGGVITALEIEMPKDAFICTGSGISMFVAGTEQYLYAESEGTATFQVDPAAVRCQVTADEATETTVELQKMTGEKTYMAASFSGKIEKNQVDFSIKGDHSAGVTASDPELELKVVADDGTKTAEYEKLKVKNAESIDPSVPIVTHTHAFGEWKTQQAATVLKTGLQVRTCSCGQQETHIINKLTPTAKVNVSKITLKVKQSTTAVKISGLAAGDSVVSWSTNNKKIATVSKKGKITGKKPGTAVITIRLASGLTKKVTVKVQKGTVQCSKLQLSAKKITLRKGKKFTLKAVRLPITCVQKITYKSSNKKVATVNSKGVITAKKKGKATITVKCGKKTVTCKITVK